MTMAKNNPYKANQYKPDPRQSLFLTNYLDPKSDTFSNAYQSAIKAGFSKRYAQNITHIMPTWLSETVGDDYLLAKAEANLREFIELDAKDPLVTLSGPVKDEQGNQIMVHNSKLLRIKSDMTKFALERLNKKKYSTRTELTGKDGDMIFKIVHSNEDN